MRERDADPVENVRTKSSVHTEQFLESHPDDEVTEKSLEVIKRREVTKKATEDYADEMERRAVSV